MSFFFNENMHYNNAFMIKINVFKMIKEFTRCMNKNIIKIKYSYTCLQSNHLLKKKYNRCK